MYRIFTRAIPGDDAVERELNAFLSSHRIVAVQSCLATSEGHGAQWVWCVEYVGDGRTESATGAEPVRTFVDYAKELPPDVFARFDALRDMRKTVATNEGVRPFVVFTNAQLAEIARRRPESLAALRKVEGVGEARAEKYGTLVLEVLARERTNGPGDVAVSEERSDKKESDVGKEATA